MSVAIRTSYVLLLLLALYGVWIHFIAASGLQNLNDAVQHSQFPDGLRGSSSFTSIISIDKHVLSLVIFNMPMVSKESPIASARLFMGEFVASMLVVIMLVAIETVRQEKRKPYPQCFMWLFLMATATSAVALPIYCLGNAIPVLKDTRRTQISLSPLSAVLPGILGVVGGYAIPAALMFDPFDLGPFVQSKWVAAFSLFPFGVQLIKVLTRGVISLVPSRTNPSRRYSDEYHVVQLTYFITGAAAVFYHYLAIAYVIDDPHLSVKGLYLPARTTNSLSGNIFVFLQIDYWLTAAALLLWMYSKLNAYRPMPSAPLFLTLVFGTLLLGPGGLVAASLIYCERLSFLQSNTAALKKPEGEVLGRKKLS
ncbi:hypothetical protein E6O75_ATG09277 [Venturia nashicola]|uniref:Uncharacterized protein n=1 Tax=Venturia nashicola TaxID=86259 RepID=A0A4Z1P2Z4_9PEZI|nr:hypothetical protein E6O75_ATG09277 [Venturia nashicola]